MKIGIACDHHGIEIKKELINYLSDRYEVKDYGPNTQDSVDYPDFAFKIGEAVRDNEIRFGILLCNTGIGMSIACNKVKKVRCAHVSNVYEAEMTRLDNDSNVIAISARKPMDEIKEIIDKFLTTEYVLVERHQRRIDKINNYD